MNAPSIVLSYELAKWCYQVGVRPSLGPPRRCFLEVSALPAGLTTEPSIEVNHRLSRY